MIILTRSVVNLFPSSHRFTARLYLPIWRKKRNDKNSTDRISTYFPKWIGLCEKKFIVRIGFLDTSCIHIDGNKWNESAKWKNLKEKKEKCNETMSIRSVRTYSQTNRRQTCDEYLFSYSLARTRYRSDQMSWFKLVWVISNKWLKRRKSEENTTKTKKNIWSINRNLARVFLSK